MMNTDRKRDHSMDILRILACLMVVGIHTAMEGWYNISPRSYNWTVLNFYDTLFRPAVPLFIMISGSLFLRRDAIDLKRLWLKNILHLFVIYVVWVIFYAVMNNGIHKALADPMVVWNEITGPTPQYHLWYLRTLINLYAIAPLLLILVRHIDRRHMRYYLTLFLMFGILRHTVTDLPFVPKWITEQINLFVDMDLVGYAGYFILGWYLSDPERCGRFSGRKLLLIWLGTVILAAGLNQWIAVADDWPTQALYGNFSLPVAVEAVCLFLLIRRRFAGISAKPAAGRILYRMAESTLFVYLIHPFVIRRLQIYLNLYTTNYNVLFSVPLMVILVFVLSSAAGMLLKKVPGLRYLL